MMIKPFSKKQLKVMTWWKNPKISKKYDAVIADGSIRSGKTMSVLFSGSAIRQCLTAVSG